MIHACVNTGCFFSSERNEQEQQYEKALLTRRYSDSSERLCDA
jgi:hypothetical protein